MRKLSPIILLLSLTILFVSSLPAPGQTPQGFIPEYLQQLDDIQTKIVGLAEAMPEAKYTWRPEAGVRSVGEVYTHIADSNRAVLKILGEPGPTAPAAPKTKAEVIAALKDSFSTLRAAAQKLPESDMDKQLKFPGRSLTERAFLVRNLGHLHEHLGQSIAYARTNGVTPPWSQKTAD